jgi:hypothetical protein
MVPTTGKIQPHITDEILSELLRVLAYPGFELTEREIQYHLFKDLTFIVVFL